MAGVINPSRGVSPNRVDPFRDFDLRVTKAGSALATSRAR